MKRKRELASVWKEEGMSLYFAWAVALAGFCLCVFFGEVLQYEPCPLCWYQRIALFPLVLILGIAAFRNDARIIPYALPLSIIGALFALFQIFERHFPSLQKTGVCNLGEACSETVFLLFGFLDLPTLSAMGFALISAFLFFARKRTHDSSSDESSK
jgi:disulfide bond formation protein DsbB